MKNKYLALVLIFSIAFLFLAGCAAKQEAPAQVEKHTTQTTTPSKEVKTEPQQQVEPEPQPEPAKQMDKKVAELLQKHIGRVTSLKYMYQDQTIKPEEWETWVTDDKMHVKLRELDNVAGDVYVDEIYLDLASKDAKGYCERTVYRCADPNTPVDVTFKKYYRKTPIDWIEGVTYAVKESEEQMQQRTVWKLVSEDGDKTTTMWVDDYYGVPLMVKVKQGSTVNEYNYEDIAFNSVDDSDLTHGLVTATYK